MKNLRQQTAQSHQLKAQSFGGSLLRQGLSFVLSFALCALSAAPLFASTPGTTTGELLSIPVGARAIGMGEAYTAAADDASALEWNPAGLSFAQQKEASFMHSSLIENVNYEHLAFINPGENYSWGASMGYLGYGDIAGYGDSSTGNPVSLGNQTAYSYAMNAGASTMLFDRLSLGVTGTFLREDLAGQGASTFAANLGTQYALAYHPLGADYRLGLSALNLGPGLKFDSERDPLPQQIKMGVSAMHVEQWPLNLTADYSMPNDNSNYISFGSEYWFHEIIALRLGYTDSNDQGKGLRVGLGLKLREFLFDYAYGSFGDFGATQRIELSMKWGEKTHQMNSEQRAILKQAKRAGDNGDYIQQILAMNELLEKDPTNDKVLKTMIKAHENMLQTELKDAVAQNDQKKEVPSPDEFALQDLVPGQAAVAQAAPAKGGFDPSDPLGLGNLPDANNGGEIVAPAPAPSPAVVPAPSAAPAVDTRSDNAPTPEAPAAPAQDGVLLNPSDIYGN
jgi:hypothetical protein